MGLEKKRIHVLEQTVDKLCSILPFEKEYYSKNSHIEYVGHPLLDQITTFKTQLQKEIQQVVFMPGSRKGEIAKLMPIYKEVRKQLNISNAIVVIPEYFIQEQRD